MYGLLLQLLAEGFEYAKGELIGCFGDCHLYNNHIDQAKEQLSRELRSLPKMTLNKEVKDINDFKFDDFELSNYDPHPHIKAEWTK